MTQQTPLDALAVNTIRGLSMDAVQAANSGHPGTPMALAALGARGWAVIAFGMGLAAWWLLEVRVLNRLFAGPLPAPHGPRLRRLVGQHLHQQRVLLLRAGHLV